VPNLVEPIRQATQHWPLPPRIIVERAEKAASFRIARAALAKSGTVTLELALAGVPMVTAYKVSTIEYLAIGWQLKKRLSSIILPNLLLRDNVVPELLQHFCTADKLADTLMPLLDDTAERRRQVEAFSRLDAIMGIGITAPAGRAAEVVLEVVQRAHSSKTRE
jgi:lipid-A-disaccharide synthase